MDVLSLRKPDFIIAGAMRCGTTAAVMNLQRHPDLWMVNCDVKRKLSDPIDGHPEMHFFSNEDRFAHGPDWYFRYFGFGGHHRCVGEKTPAYIENPKAIERMAALIPNAKIIVLLRDPFHRAYSHWRFIVGKGKRIDFEACFRQDPMVRRKGAYAGQLAFLLKHYPKEQVHISISERVKSNMAHEYGRIFRFLGLSALGGDHGFGRFNVSRGERQWPLHVEREIRSYYRPLNEELFELLGMRIPEWHSEPAQAHDLE